MISREQAIQLGEKGGTIHSGECKLKIGPRGGRLYFIKRWRPSGRCIVWKREPERFRLPVKNGLWVSDYVTNTNASFWHLEQDCPVLKEGT